MNKSTLSNPNLYSGNTKGNWEIEKTQRARDEAGTSRNSADRKGQDCFTERETGCGVIYASDLKIQISEQQERVQMFQTEYNKIVNSVDGYDKKLQAANETLKQHEETAGQRVQEIDAANSASARMGEAVDDVNGYMGKFTKRIAKLVRKVFGFTLISSVLQFLKTWLGKAIESNDEARASIEKLMCCLPDLT